MPDEQPDQAGDHDREVQDVIVKIEYLHDRRIRQDKPLQGGLAREVQHTLGVPEPACPVNRPIRPHQRERTGELPQGEQPDDQGCLPDEGASGTQPPCGHCPPLVRAVRLVIARPASPGYDPAPVQQCRRRECEARRACRGLLPGRV